MLVLLSYTLFAILCARLVLLEIRYIQKTVDNFQNELENTVVTCN